eukprot:XP_002944068.2 PREDICTED: E3 ubiquitin-protein ligase TRIM39-like [Xenopus tropicalis]
MAAADLREELTCSVCREIYTDPVSLPCGHNFCQCCIGRTWDWQEGIEEDPSCPECRRKYKRRPELQRNLRLSNIATRFLPESRKCSAHNEPLKYHCCEDGAPICVSCCLAGGHRGHRVELLSEASEKKKEKLRKVLEKLSPEREETERGAQRLQERRGELEEKAAIETERVIDLFRDIRRWADSQEERLLSDISRQKEELSLTLTELIQQLEIKKDELSRKIRHIEELCNMADPLTVLQEQWESHGAAFCGADNGGRERGGIKDPAVGDLDVDLGGISETLLTGLAGIIIGLKGRIYGQEATELVLDRCTAGANICLSPDRKLAYHSDEIQEPYIPEEYQDAQVLSTTVFTTGQYYWDLIGSDFGDMRVGVAYPSMKRRGSQSLIGENDKSWCLFRCRNNTVYIVKHNGTEIYLPHAPTCRRVRIWLDYEAGRLSFYELSEPIKHLHTFTATFTEPLHAAFWVWGWMSNDVWVRILCKGSARCPAGEPIPRAALPRPVMPEQEGSAGANRDSQ